MTRLLVEWHNGDDAQALTADVISDTGRKLARQPIRPVAAENEGAARRTAP